MRPPSRQQGFSLMELLIVFAIVIVVTGLLFGASGRIRAVGDLARCTSHLRSLHLGVTQFLHDRNQNFTSARWDLASTHLTTPGIRDYLGLTGTERRPTLLTCPALQRGASASGRWMQMNYGINTRATRGYHGSSLETARVVTHPNRFLLFSEGVVNPGGSADVIDGANYFVAVSWTQLAQMQWVHKGSQNAVFMDGHVRLIRPEDFPTGSSAWRQPLWSGSEPPL